MVKGVKRCLRKTLANVRLSYDELLTLVIEVESTLNVRPLTYVYEEDEEDSSKGLNKRMKYLSLKLDHFWKRWKREYLSELREHHKRNVTKGGAIVEIGDIVTVAEEGVSRGKWRLGKVEELITGKDGEIRGANVKVLTKKGKPMYLNRPVKKLYPLAVRRPVQTRQSVTESVEEEQVQTWRVPRRAAAIDADLRRRCVHQLLANQEGRMS